VFVGVSDEDASPIKKRGRPKKAATAKKKKAAQDTTAEDAFLAESSSDDGAELLDPDGVCGRDCGGSTFGFVLMLFQNSYPSLAQFYPYTLSLQYADIQYFCWSYKTFRSLHFRCGVFLQSVTGLVWVRPLECPIHAGKPRNLVLFLNGLCYSINRATGYNSDHQSYKI
jgi:hypothetical protein